MTGRLMLGKRSIGIRFSEVIPSTTAASDAMRTAIAFRIARRVSHMEPRSSGSLGRLGLHGLTFTDQLLALDDDPVVRAQPLRDLNERPVDRTERDRSREDLAVADEQDAGPGLSPDQRLEWDQQGAALDVDDELDTGVHAGLQQPVGV